MSPIGLFDSGVGGLTVLRAVRRFLPHEPLVYVGDTARVPWGTKGPATVQRYAVGIARHLESRGCRAIVIACHTASTLAVDAVRAAVEVPVIDVVAPVAAALAADPSIARVLVLGTRGTIGAGAYPRALHALRPDLDVRQQACPLFVPLVEEGWVTGDVPERVVRHYLEPAVRGFRPDAIVLGCTHYPLLAEPIRHVLSRLGCEGCAVVESGSATAAALASALEHVDRLQQGQATTAPNSVPQYLVTDDPAHFATLGTRFLGEPIDAAELLPLAVLDALD